MFLSKQDTMKSKPRTSPPCLAQVNRLKDKDNEINTLQEVIAKTNAELNSIKASYDVSQKKQLRVGRWLAMIFLLFSVSVLAEANRSPFDFAEGESELVSGFNTEYRSVIFVIVFLAEYIAIIFISMLTSILFLITSYTEIIIFTGFVGFFYI